MLTVEQLKTISNNYSDRIYSIQQYLNIVEKKDEIDQLTNKMNDCDFWNDKENAQKTISKLNSLKSIVEPFDKVNTQIKDFIEFIGLSEEDSSILEELENLTKEINNDLDELELVSYLSDKLDNHNAYLTLHAGEGGTEACDWTEMLTRMYYRYFDKNGWKYNVIDVQPGDEAGLKSITFKVDGDFVYGYLKSERGVHRLVRISPFDSNKRRHTSFASVEIMPEADGDIDIEIKDEDIRVDVYRSSGHGGQGVNTTDSAVRITHYPSGIVVTCQNDRSQIKNKATAMSVLKSKLYEIELEKRKAEEEKIRGIQSENTWGSQIRSYVFCPYQMVKDLRTDYTDYNIDDVMNGNIQGFINAYIKMKK